MSWSPPERVGVPASSASSKGPTSSSTERRSAMFAPAPACPAAIGVCVELSKTRRAKPRPNGA